MSAPAPAQGRIESLDVIRGFALLGILAVNAPAFAAPWQTTLNPTLPPLQVTDETLWSWFAPYVLLEGKCIALFSMLFGVSLLLIGEGEDGGRRLARRFVVLLGFGLVHGLVIWDGDILVVYALAGLALMGLRRMGARDLILLGFGLYAGAALLLYQAGAFIAQLDAEAQARVLEQSWAPNAAELARVREAYLSSAWSATAENAREWVTWFFAAIWFIGPAYGGLILAGMGLGKAGYFSARAPTRTYVLAITAGVCALLVIFLQALESARLGFPALRMLGEAALINRLLAPIAALGYASALILMLRADVVRAALAPLAAAGRMAFSNYFAQSLIMTGIFWGGRGLGWFGQVDRPTLLLVVAGVWAAQLIWSPLWLAAFKRGPLEWAWRSLTEGRALDLR